MGYWHEKVVVITGGSSGFGRSLAGRFAGSGARVIIAARRQEKLEAAAQSIAGDITARTVDITCDESVQDLVDGILKDEGRIDAWINNAGRSNRGQAAETTSQEFSELLDLNFLGTVRCSPGRDSCPGQDPGTPGEYRLDRVVDCRPPPGRLPSKQVSTDCLQPATANGTCSTGRPCPAGLPRPDRQE